MNFFTPNTDFSKNFYEKYNYIISWRFAIIFSVVFFTLSLISYSHKQIVFSPFLVIFIASSFAFFYLKITKKAIPIFWIYVIIGTIFAHISLNTTFTVIRYTDFLWMITTIIVAFFSLGKKVGFLFTLIHVSGIIYFLTFNSNKYINNLLPQTNLQLVGSFIEVSLALLIIVYLLNQQVVFTSYSRKKLEKINIKLSKINDKNQTLIKEIHHRVKNNLQIIISLLRLQKNELKPNEAERHFSESINRIMVMSLIHKKLYQEKELEKIEVKSYLTDLTNDVIHISTLEVPIKFNISSQISRIGLKTIVPLGLLINELLSNSIKHAFLERNEGFIDIKVLKGNGNDDFILIYVDNGRWTDPEKNNAGFGISLIETLSEQLDGSYTRNESEYTFTIKNLDN